MIIQKRRNTMSLKKHLLLAGLAFFAISLFTMVADYPPSFAQEIIIKPYKTLTYNPSKRFVPPAEDKAGYWYEEDYGNVIAFDFCLETSLLAAVVEKYGMPSKLFILDLRTGEVKNKSEISNSTDRNVKSIKISSDGKMIAIPVGKDNLLSLWDTNNGTLINKKETGGFVNDVDWHPTGKFLAVAAGENIEIWGASPLVKQMLLPGGRIRSEWPMCVQWSPDGGYFAIGTNGPNIYIGKYDGARSSQGPSLLPKLKTAISMVEWNALGTHIAAAEHGLNGKINVWSNPKGSVGGIKENYQFVKEFVPFQGHSWTKMTWDPSGKLVAFGDDSFNFFVWEISSGRLLKKFTPHPKSNTLEAHWKGNYLMTVGGLPDKTFKMWQVEVR
jgi:WD40 repeat protein